MSKAMINRSSFPFTVPKLQWVQEFEHLRSAQMEGKKIRHDKDISLIEAVHVTHNFVSKVHHKRTFHFFVCIISHFQ